MAPSSTRAASIKKPSSAKTKPKASSNKKTSAMDTKKGLRAQKAAGKKTQLKELVDLLHDELTEPEEEDPPATPEPEPLTELPVPNAKLVSTKMTPLKKVFAPPLKTLTPKSRVSLARSSTWIEKELESHEEPEEEQEPEMTTEECAIGEGGKAKDESLKESHVKETTVELMDSEEEEEQPRKGLSKILNMVPPFGADLNTWRANGGMSKFRIKLIKFLSRHSKRRYWLAVPSTAASFMGPAFHVQWHVKMEWVEGDQKAVVGRDDKPPFNTWALRHQMELEATLAGNKEPDEGLKSVIKAEEKAWNALSMAEQAQHLLDILPCRHTTEWASKGKTTLVHTPMKPTSACVHPKTTVVMEIPTQCSQLRVSVSAAASLPPLLSKSPSMVESTLAPDDKKAKVGKKLKNFSKELRALAAKAEPDLLPMSDGISPFDLQAFCALDGTTKATWMSPEFDILLNLDYLHGTRLSIMDICLLPVWLVLYFTKMFWVLCKNPIPCNMCGSNKVGQQCTGSWNHLMTDWKSKLKQIGCSCDLCWCKGYSCSFIMCNKETAGESSKAAGSKCKAMVNLTGDDSKKPNKRAKSSTVKMESELAFTIPDAVMRMVMAWRDADSPMFLKFSGTFHKFLSFLFWSLFSCVSDSAVPPLPHP
ncbi:hypothetical protein DACRYDRAFT_105203 [Dacryopinax primogenitus]|uniref:Uncharacterized protein n=1 Tax=Dacryopinax primogenitus (strain DJM 731) TaxID=1858805 RepID=M5G7I5_DACPD|nr:uncharacterized protein DACRYDRAFT_105203 [Dacryopinax primogenitus]EJU04135.1 hypothetical protein DACRYDRAFT_105203 [Dacryopinax primogenitus]